MANKRKSYDELLAERNGGANKNSASFNSASDTESSRKSYDDLLLERNAPSAIKSLNSRLKKYAEDSYNISQRYQSRYFDKDGNYLNQYRGDASDWLKSVRSKNDYLSTEADAIRNALETYKAYISEDSYKEISDILATNSKALSDIYSASREDNRYWSQWESEDAYKAALAKLEEDEKLRTYDLKAAEEEMAQIRNKISQAEQESASYEYTPLDEGSEQFGRLSEEEKNTLRSQHYLDYMNTRSGWKSAYEKELSEKEAYYEEAKRVQTAYKLASVANPESENYDPDFEHYAAAGEAIENPSFEEAQGWFGVKEGAIQNPVKFTRDNYVAYAAKTAGSSMNGGSDPQDWGINHLYMEMTDDEYKTYNYYLAKDSENNRRGKQSNLASEYIDSLDLKDRFDQKVLRTVRDATDDGFWSGAAMSAVSVATSLGSGVEYLQDLFNYASTGEMDSNLMANVTNTIRGTVSENVDWEIGNWDAFDFVYNTGMSGVDSLVSGVAFGKAGGVVLGLSAAAQGTNDALDRGMSNSQAFWNGLSAGVLETLLETVSIGQFDALKDSFVKNGKDIAKNLAKTMLVNASEETLTEIANLTYDRIVNGDFSQYEIAVRKYMEEEGMSFAEAKNRVAREQAFQVFEAGASGALMGFGFGTIGSAANARGSYKAGKAIKADGKVDSLVDLGKTFSPDSDIYKFAEGINGDSSSLSVGRLLKGVQGELSGQNMTDIQNALVERGVSEQEAANLAKWMNKVVNGGTLSKSQQAALENNPVLAEVLYGTIMSSDSSVMQRGSLYNQLYDIASSMGVDRNALEAQQTPEAITQRMNDRRAFGEDLRRGANNRMGLSEADLSQIADFASKARTTIPEANYQDVGQSASNEPSSAKIADVTDRVSDTGKPIVKSTNEEVSIKKIASIDAKNKTMKLELSNGKVVDSNDIEYGNREQAALYETVLLMGYDTHTANAIVHGYTPSSTVSVEHYLIGTRQAFNYGWGHIPEKARIDDGYMALTQEQREYAVKLGEDARDADDKVRGIRTAQKQPRIANKKPKDGYKARISEKVDLSKVPEAVRERVNASIKALDAVAKALKVNVVVDDFSRTKHKNSNGYYDPSRNEIVVSINAGGDGTLLFTASHELVHYIRDWNAAKFTILADFLMEQYASKGEDIDALIDDEIKKAYKASRGDVMLTYDEAYEEVVAQAMQRFLTDSNFIERLAELRKKDASLAEKLVTWLKEVLNRIKAAYQGATTKDFASQAVKEMGEAIDELYAKMEEALIAASEASQTIGSRNLEDFSEAKNTDGKELFQYKAMEADEETYRQMLKKHGLMSESEINKLFSTIDKALVIIKNNLEVLDYAWEADIDDRAFSPVKPNTDNLYKVSLDFSTLCRKRILQQVIQIQLQDALNKPISREESIAIRDELMKIQEEGRQIEIACALCYVESARMKSPAQIKKFMKDRETVIKEFLASKSGGDIKQKIKQAEADAREKLHKENPKGVKGTDGGLVDPRSAKLKQMTEKVADVIRLAKKEAKKSYTPTAEEQKLIDAAKSMSITDFTSPEGLANLAKNYPVLFDAYTSYVRNATHSKGIEKDTWWRAGDSASIGDALIANMNRENGLRSQSWSDFQVIHLLDYIAATIELSTKNAKEQAYSKVPDYIELMGNTGVMLNMSLIPMAKFNGKLEYDSVEGMAYKKALELREKYHATAGTICIGISDEQIKMLLDDSSIDYVIPYHKSGMAAHIRKLMHIPTWSEYELYQNETNLSRNEAIKQAKKYGVNLLSESDPNYQKHTAFSEWFDIEEARQIAKQENTFPTDAKLQKKYGVMYGGYMAMQNAANNYLKLCAERGIAPKFSHENANFTTEANYWKLIIDRKMVDNVTGEIIEQQAIKPIFDEAEVLRILNDELERYPGIKADQEYATRTVVEKFLSGKMNDRLDADTVAAIIQKPVDNITTTNIVASEEGVKAQYAEESFSGRYSYEGLTSKPDMKLTAISNNVPKNRADVVSEAKKNAAKVGKFNPKDGSVSVHIKDVGEDVVISTGGLRHSLDRRFDVNAPVAVKAGEILQNSIRINEMIPENANADSSYALIGAARNEKGELYIVRSVVNRFKSELVSMDVLYAINAKTEPNLGIKKGNQVGAYPQGSLSNDRFLTDSTISIAQLLDYVNKYFPDVLPESVLRHYGYDARPEGKLGNDVLYQYADTDYAPAFYSQMGKVVEGVKQEKLAANSIVNMLRGKGVKAEEIRWSGIVPFLDGKKSVTKQELLDFINGSMLQIGEQMSDVVEIEVISEDGDNWIVRDKKTRAIIDEWEYSDDVEDGLSGWVNQEGEIALSEDELKEKAFKDFSSTRWSDYKLDGGEKYREIVFTMPNSSYSNQMMRTHWGDDAEGVLVHARIQDFDVNGKKMLFVEEIQSDYHNEGHQSGYSDSKTDAKIDELKAIAEEKFFALEDYSTEMTGNAGEWETIEQTEKGAKLLREYREAQNAYDNAMNEAVKKIPDAPFKDTYHEYVLKRLLRMAAEQGYDSIGWTPADIQDKRWSDNQYHEEGKGKSGFLKGYTVEYDQDIPKFLRKYGRQWGATVGKTSLDGTEVWSMDITDSMKNSVLYEGQAMFQYKDLDAIDNRTLLAKSLEGAAKNDVEKTKLKEYQKKIELINAEEKKLRELRGQIKEISFSKGARDTEKLKKLQFEANQAANRINVYDKQLLRLEATKPLMEVLQREKDLVRKKMDKERKEAVKKAKEKDMATIREIMDRHTESRKKAMEKRNMAQIRNKIKAFKAKLESNLLTPTDRGYVPFGLAQAMIDVCSLIDTDTDLYKSDGNINKAQVQRNLTKDKLQALKDEYEKLKDYDDPVYSGEFDDAIYLMLKDLKENYEGRTLKEMSIDELRDMYDILRSIGDTLADARNLIGKGESIDVYEAGDAIISEQREVARKRKKDKRSGSQKAKDGIINLSLAPVRNVERMSGYKEDSVLVDLFNDFEIGVRQKDFFEMESKKSFEAVTTGENAKAYESAVYDAFGNKSYMDAHGKAFSISKMQMMQAILSQDRERANGMNHIKGGGLVFADLDLLRKGDLKEAISSENSHLVSIADGVVEQFRQELANDKWAQEYMAVARAFFDGKAKDAINNTMLTLKHRIVAKDKNYIPFEVDKNFVVREISAANDIQQTINSYGMLQETKDKAPQPLIMTGLNNIIDRHIDQVSAVVGLAIPVRNFNKVWNVHSVDGVDTTVNNAIETNWGKEGKKFIEQAVQDIQGPRHNSQSELYKKVKSGYIGATFLLNGSVVAKQIGSMFAATSMLRWRDPVSMMGNLLYTMANYKKIAAEVDKYTASAWKRRQGMSDAEVYSLITEGKKHPVTKALNKLPAPLNPTKWIVGMDSAVALSLWKYAKQDVQRAHPELSGEELNRATASFYDSVIENTQSMTDVLHRPEIQKRSDIMSEAFGMFKTDLYQMSGQLQNAVGRFSENKSKENGKYLCRTVYSIAASAIWGTLMTTAFALLRYKVKPYRDDEDDELTVESWIKRQSFAFGGDLVGYLLPLFGSEVIGTIENIVYGESEDIADSLVLTAINDLYSTAVGIASALKEGEAPSIDDYKKLLTKSLQVFGVPANNILRTIEAVRLHAKDIANGEFFSFEAGRDKSNGQSLYEAILRGNEDQIEDLKLQFDDDDAIDNALVKAIRENNPEVAETASKYINGNLSAYESMVASLVRQGFDEDVAVRAIRSVITMVNSAAQLKADGDTEDYKEKVDNLIDLGYDEDQLESDIAVVDKQPSEDDSEEASSIYKASDINVALENGNATTARNIIDELVQVKIENYMSEGVKKSEAKKKAEASVKSSITSYWKPLYLEAKANKDLNEVKRIKALLKATKLYDNVTETTDSWWDAYRKSKK